jgi:Tol biopolymer transport system component
MLLSKIVALMVAFALCVLCSSRSSSLERESRVSGLGLYGKPLVQSSSNSGAIPSTSHYSYSSDNRWRWNPRGRGVLISAIGTVIVSRKEAKKAHVRLGRWNGGCDWSSDGERIVTSLASYPPQELFISRWSDPRNRSQRKLIGAGFASANYAPSWEPGGKRIAFLTEIRSGNSMNNGVAIVDADGKNARLLRLGLVSRMTPIWCPKGGKLLVVLNLEEAAFATVDANSGRSRTVRVRNADGGVRGADWAPDGKRIVFCGQFSEPEKMSPRLRILNLANNRITRLGSFNGDTTELLSPAWSPDGKWIAVVIGGPKGQDRLALVNTATGISRIVLRGGLYDWPAWSPTGRFLAVDDRENYSGERHYITILRIRNGTAVEERRWLVRD